MKQLTPAQRDAARAALAQAENDREEILLAHIAAGVRITSRSVEIGAEVEIAPGAVILPGCVLRGRTKIAAGCVIGPNTLIEDSEIGEGTCVNASQVYASQIGRHNNIGPFTHIRAGTVTDYGVHLGAYVETKNSNFARGNTVSHLTYIGDSDVGKYCNFGCGTVTCNYDGKDKFRTTIGDYCFIGCNTNLVPPVKLGDGAYTAAGSTITADVPAGDLGIARSRQTNVAGWAKPKMEAYIAKKRKLEQEQEAAEAESEAESAKKG
jgi:bifunctional UDP-N-acetylglucosamine pyrophosphorylase/glucosamine-1-phosphate N-acetyltransferase